MEDGCRSGVLDTFRTSSLHSSEQGLSKGKLTIMVSKITILVARLRVFFIHRVRRLRGG